MDKLSEKEKEAITRLLKSDVIQNEMGAENWDLTEEEENLIWNIINRLD